MKREMFMPRFFSSSSLRLPSLVVPLVLVLTFTTTTISAQKAISSAADLKAFAEEVSGGSGTYSGSTVTLAADIDLAGIDFIPIGTYIDGTPGNDFRGIFEGNGHVIKNMNLTSSSLQYMGLFGYSFGCTIKDVVIDSSSSVANSINDKICYAGGIIGYADTWTDVGEIRIQNCVNMGTIKGTGGYSRIGGIAGALFPTNHNAFIENCVNLGDIVYTGTGDSSYIGGIVGWISALSGKVGYVSNCVNLGKITSTPAVIGAIAGNNTLGVSVIENSYWLEGTAPQGYGGAGSVTSGDAFDSEYKITSTGASLADVFGSCTSCKWNKVTFNTSGGSYVEPMMAMFVLTGTPSTPTKTGYTLEGWYMEPELNTPWNSNTKINSDITLHAKWKINLYTVTFTTNGGSSLGPITSDYLSTIPLPTPTRTGYTFTFWSDGKGNPFQESYTITRAENVTLTAQWTVNQYTVTFNTNGGDNLSESERTKGVTYDQQYGELPVPTRTGHSFNGWFNEGGESVTRETIVTTPNDHTLTAQWTPNNYTVTFDFGNGTIVEKRVFAFNETIDYPENFTKEGYTFDEWDNNVTRMPANNLTIKAQWVQIPTEFVEVIFEKNDMNEKEIRDFISDYTQDENYQIKIFNSESEGTTVILKFNDVEKAENFVETIKALSNSGIIIQKIGYTQEILFSFSTMIIASLHFLMLL